MKTTAKLVLTTMTLVLAACGGGGGGGSPAAAPAPTPVPTPVAAGPTSTYPAGSQELAYFTALNAFRIKIGLAPFAQSTALDLAARNHLAYILKYSTLNGGPINMSAIDPKSGRSNIFIEDTTLAGSTGVDQLARATAAGYPATPNVQFDAEDDFFANGLGTAAVVQADIGTVFHRQTLQSQFTQDLGIAVGTDTRQTVVIEQGFKTKAQPVAPTYLGIYPIDGDQGIGLTATPEVPTIAGLAAADYATQTGYPVSIAAPDGTTLAVTSFTVTEAGQPAPLSVRLLTTPTDATTKQFLPPSVAYIVPNAPLKAATTYNVTFVGTVNGAPIAKVWSFKTA